MKLGIAMIPDLETINAVVTLQKTLLPLYSLSPLLGTQHNLPHITLLQGRFQNNPNWTSLLSDLQNYCHKQKHSLEFQTTGLKYQPLNWLFLNITQNMMFHNTQQFIFERLKDLMFLTHDDLLKDISRYSLLERENYLKYGYRYIGDAFHPHITLGRISKNCQIDNEFVFHYSNIVSSKISGLIQTVTLYQMGENGSHANTLYALDI